jgi:hypothetical protein
VHRVDQFEAVGLLGFHDHHSNEYYFKPDDNLRKTIATLPSFGAEISTVVHVPSLKCFVFFLRDRSLALVDSYWSVKLRIKCPEVLMSASQTKSGDIFAVGVSGTVYFIKTDVLIGPKLEQLIKLGLDNWRMFIDPVEVESLSGYINLT